MKSFFYFTTAALIIATGFTSCKKDKKKSGNGLPAPVNAIISQDIINSLQKQGTVINAGVTPPSVAGTYLNHPNVCTYDNSESGLTGQTIADYLYKFSNQNNSNSTIRLDYSNIIAGGHESVSDSTSTFISGSGTLFTIFSQNSGVESGISLTQLIIISGEIANGGIKNLQFTNYLQSKGPDPTPLLVPVGSMHIFHDSDGFSETTSATLGLNGIKTLHSISASKAEGLSIWSKGFAAQ